MGRARVSACAARRTDFEAEACVELAKAWHCPADIRVAFDQRWGAGAFVVMQPKQGQWYGIVFARRSGKWTVIGFDGGDIP